jgi:hypothetical protein
VVDGMNDGRAQLFLVSRQGQEAAIGTLHGSLDRGLDQPFGVTSVFFSTEYGLKKFQHLPELPGSTVPVISLHLPMHNCWHRVLPAIDFYSRDDLQEVHQL